MPSLSVGVPVVATIGLGAAGCGSSAPVEPVQPLDAGAPDAPAEDPGCPPGELEQPDHSCRPAGIGPDECGVGFVHDGEDSCDEVLPSEPCPPGTMAIPGEAMCREMAHCGKGTWSSIPVDAATQYVNAAYAGGDSDGTPAKPWPTVQKGVNAATFGAIVAVAAGSYPEHVLVQGKPVRIWGRCPELVEIVGPDGMQFVLDVRGGADGTEIHGLAVTGSGRGFAISGSEGVTGDRLWIHDTSDPGFMVQDDLGETSATLRRSLIEAAGDIGVYGFGATIDIEESVVRDTRTSASGTFGHGIQIVQDPQSKRPTDLVLRRSLIEHTHEGAIHVFGSSARVEDSVLRDTLPSDSDSSGGAAVWVWRQDDTGGRGSLTMRRSVIAGSHTFGVSASDSDLDLDTVVVRDTQPDPSNQTDGIAVLAADTVLVPEGQSKVRVQRSVVEGARMVGLGTAGVDATIESVVVRDVEVSLASGKAGRGMSLESNGFVSPFVPGAAVVRGCRVERTHETGATCVAATCAIESTLVRDTEPRSDGVFGRGITAEHDLESGIGATLSLDRVRVERSHEFGIFIVGSHATIDRAAVLDTATRAADGSGGVGLAVQLGLETGTPAEATISRTTIERSRQSGISVLGAIAALDQVVIRDTGTDDHGAFGDGLTVTLYLDDPTVATTAHVTSATIEASARAGISTFGAHVSIGDSTLECNPIHLDGETFAGTPFELTDLGGNACGCQGAPVACAVLSSNLNAASPVEN